jgi:ABC-type glycerol-3-phosphate transport system permease component
MTATEHRTAALTVTGRDIAGPVVQGRPRPAASRWLGVPALVLVGGVLVVPIVLTLLRSLRTPDGGVGLDNFVALYTEQDARRALANTLGWVLIALGVSALALAIAVLSSRVRQLATVLLIALVAPLGVSALVAGVGFRLIYDPSPQRGTASAVAVAVHGVFTDPAPLAGARPAGSGGGQDWRLVSVPTGELTTDGALPPGEVLDVRLAGVDADNPNLGPAGSAAPLGSPGDALLLGRVVAEPGDRPVRGLPVRLTVAGRQLDQTRTGEDGAFRFDLAELQASGADVRLVIPAGAVSPAWLGPAWLTPGLIWVALVSAFAWGWLGLAVSLFRRGLGAVSPDLLRMARAEGVGWVRRQLTIVLPLLRPVIAVVVLTLVVAALRLFDLVLIAVPGSVQDDVNVVAVQWWRTRGDDGQAAAMATLLFVAVAVVALTALAGLRGWGEHRAPTGVAVRPAPPTGWPRRWLGVALAAVVAAVWLFPLLVLIATSLHSPRDAALSGWWRPGADGLGLESYAEAVDTGLWAAVGSTAVLAVTATALVLLCAVPAAYLLAWGDLPGWVSKGAVVGLAALAVAPVQMYAAPLADLLAAVGLAGSRTPLILVHAAAGVPFAVLLLRTAFAAAPASLLAATRAGEAGQWRAMELVRRRGADSLVAVAVLEFVGVWNDFTLGLLVSGPGSSPLTIVLWGQARQFGTSAGPVAAAAMISVLVPVIVVLVRWRRVVNGLTGRTDPARRAA